MAEMINFATELVVYLRKDLFARLLAEREKRRLKWLKHLN